MREHDNKEIFIAELFGMEPLSTICGVVHLVRRKYSVKPFCIASACPYYCFFLSRFYTNEKVLKDRLDSETVD